MSAFGGLTMGMKLTKQLNLDTKIDVKLEQYGQKGVWILSAMGISWRRPVFDVFNAISRRSRSTWAQVRLARSLRRWPV